MLQAQGHIRRLLSGPRTAQKLEDVYRIVTGTRPAATTIAALSELAQDVPADTIVTIIWTVGEFAKLDPRGIVAIKVQ